MDTAQWPDQELVFKPMEEIVVTKPSNTCSSSSAAEAVGRNHEHGHVGAPDSYKNQPSAITEKKKAARPQVKDVNCPRCNSTNTKFCYYNNYSLTQPRYFCKTCKRYWTEGGTLRNIPVGGVSRKNKRSSSAAAAASKLNSTASNKMSKLPDLVVTTAHANFPNHPLYSLYQNPKDLLHYHEGQDLNLGFFSRSAPNLNHHDEFRGLCEFMHLPSTHTESTVAPNSTTSDVPPHNHSHNPNNPHHQHQLSALELITGLASSRGGGFASFMPMSIGDPNLAVYSSSEAGGFPLQRTDDHFKEFKPTVNFSLEGLGGGGGGGYDGGNLQGGGMGDGGGNEQSHRSINGRLLFPFEDLKQPEHRATSTTTTNDQRSSDHRPEQQDNKEREATAGYWSGLLGGAAAGTGLWVNKSKEGSES